MYYYFITNYQDVFERESQVDTSVYPQYTQLTAEQMEYHLAHPEAKRWEIEHHNDPVPEPTVEQAKMQKLNDITYYDNSEAVNQFYIGNGALWLDKATRVSLNYAIDVAERKGTTDIDLWYGTHKYTLPVTEAKTMLAEVEAYAYECFNVTAQHKANVEALTTVAEIQAYDYTTGYPEKLYFDETIAVTN